MDRICRTHGEIRNAYEIQHENLNGRDLAVQGKMTLKEIFKKQDVRACTGFKWLSIGSNGNQL